MGKIFYVFYLSLLIGFLLAIISFQSFWLEMRVNIGLLIPVYTAVFYAAFYSVMKRVEHINGKHKLFAFGSLLASSAASLMLLGPERIKVVPAAIVREGLNLVHVKYSYINLAICVFLLAGLIIILTQRVDHENK